MAARTAWRARPTSDGCVTTPVRAASRATRAAYVSSSVSSRRMTASCPRTRASSRSSGGRPSPSAPEPRRRFRRARRFTHQRGSSIMISGRPPGSARQCASCAALQRASCAERKGFGRTGGLWRRPPRASIASRGAGRESSFGSAARIYQG